MADAAGPMDPPNTYVFDGRRSRQGYRINRLSMSLIDPANRDAFRADEDAYMKRFGLSDEERRMVRERDWKSMIANGGNIYLILKIGGTVGVNLLQMGAQMRGETMEEFLKTRPAYDLMPKGGH